MNTTDPNNTPAAPTQPSATTEQRVALVTGGARRIGAQISRQLHARGLKVAVHCRHSLDAAQSLADELNTRRADSAIVVRAALHDRTAIKQLPDTIIQHWGRLDVLVHNASTFYPTAVGTVDDEQWDDLFASNLRGPFFLSQAAASELKTRGGCIVCVIDIHAQRPLRGHPVYCMAKAGLHMMTLSLAKELAPEVRVNGVAPGYILQPSDGMDDQVHQTILDRTALNRRGSPEDIAGAVVYLALDAPYVSGQVLAVDGGRSLHM